MRSAFAFFALVVFLPSTIGLAQGVENQPIIPAVCLDPAVSNEGVRCPPNPPMLLERSLTSHRNIKPRIREALQNIINSDVLNTADFGLSIVRASDGVTLAESGADLLINPASNAKLATSAAALALLKPEFRFKTEYYIKGRIKDGVLWGNLHIKGYGDPTVVSERLMRVANELYLYGIERIRGNIVVDSSYFDANENARGWELEESPDRAYAAPVSATSLNYNAIAIHIRPGERGQPAVVRVDPPVDGVVLEGEVRTARWGRRLRIMTKADKEGTSVQVSGAVGYRSPPHRWYRRVYDPAQYFGATLAYFLRQRGVKVNKTIRKGLVPQGARLIHIDVSKRLTQVISDLNHYSNNFVAETLVKAIAAEATGEPGSFHVGLALMREYLEDELGFVKGSYVLGNGSGLNDVNRLTARQTTTLLRAMANDFEIGTEFATSLAVAGTQGTVRNRMKRGAARRRIRAKTGTLRGVSALSGFVVTPQNEVLCFSIYTQGYHGSVRRVWKVQNAIGEVLASDGESWAPLIEDVELSMAVSSSGTSVSGTSVSGKSTEPQKGGNP
ncbi:MAG: D-alanyl-D-alanine carboxypeptidase/D-alanyl-D-alanine-endopeptidase [Deltaproteobacteria bacterium]|nr:D-alanyl-D-alanine carboxypeptidase/D-alanyl-D-alanine-endopeptidase [Deltaproteobacteria bacterium]